jgi:hypothetical protein
MPFVTGGILLQDIERDFGHLSQFCYQVKWNVAAPIPIAGSPGRPTLSRSRGTRAGSTCM